MDLALFDQWLDAVAQRLLSRYSKTFIREPGHLTIARQWYDARVSVNETARVWNRHAVQNAARAAGGWDMRKSTFKKMFPRAQARFKHRVVIRKREAWQALCASRHACLPLEEQGLWEARRALARYRCNSGRAGIRMSEERGSSGPECWDNVLRAAEEDR